jgi:uncharacterized membrane protein YphA (DoxX/SURF4 family)
MEKLISKLKQNRLLQIFTISLRYLVGSAFVYAGISKIDEKVVMPKSEANAWINTAYHFFKTMFESGLYWHFIGWSQVTVGFLLMSQVFSTAGAVAFFPIMLSIFILSLSFESITVPIFTFFLLLGNIYLLLWDWHKLKFIVLPMPQTYADNNTEFSRRKIWTYLGLFYFFGVILIRKAVMSNGVANNATRFVSMNVVLACVSVMVLSWMISNGYQWMKK